MEFIVDYIKMFNYRKIILPFIFILLFIFGFIYLNNRIDDNSFIKEDLIVYNEDAFKEVNVSTISDETFVKEFIFIDVKGAVKNPGVYKLDKDSRVIDAINVSGGLLKNANTMYMNLSKILIDSDVVKVYTNDEIEDAFKEEKVEIIEPCICEEVICDLDNNEQSSDNDINVNSKININTASVEELDTLNGIGEAKAKAIFEYRNSNGNYSKIEDIMNVSGISESIFEKIKDYITV